jgi:NADH-quinone oxidoreductase subunit N
MKPFIAPQLLPAFPEIFLAGMTLLLLLLGVAGSKENYKVVSRLSVFALACVALIVARFAKDTFVTFNGMFVTDGFAAFMKMLVIAGSAISIVMAAQYTGRARIMRYEYPVLILFSTLGMMLMISAHDLMSLYMGLELQSLPLYILASIQRDSLRSTEAGLKYFVLGALSSGLLLYGLSLLYGFTGTTNFEVMAGALTGVVAPGVVFGVVLVTAGLAFKIAAVPFHMWAPDVYEGAPTSVTAFFAIVPKIAALALLTRVFMGPFGHLVAEWRQVIVVISIASMVLGGVAAIAQTNIKRLLAYSAIGHMGYALMGLAAATRQGVEALLIYATLYMVASIGAFSVVLMMKQKDRMVEKISDLAGIGRTRPMMALAMTIVMFSMAGIPPLAGFFGKLFVFQAAIEAKLYGLAVTGVLASVVAAYYYLRIIKIMYFDEAGEEALDAPEDGGLNFALAISSLALIFFIVMPGPLITAAETAARSLMP